MVYLVLSILANVGILLCFKGFSKFRLDTLQAIVFNYLVCVITGVIFIGDTQLFTTLNSTNTWIFWAGILGMVFIFGFNLTAITTQRMGITVASVANKMSLVIPVLMSMLVFQIQSKEYSLVNYIGILLALVSVILTSIKQKEGSRNTPVNIMVLLLPLSVFLIGGFIDTTINYVNYRYVSAEHEAIFPVVIFGTAFLVGTITLLIKKERIQLKNILGGTILGVINYFSIYFLVKGLSSFNNDGALVYPVLNVGIIIFSAIASVIIFNEKLSKMNKFGLVIAVISVLSIFYQEIWKYIN